MLTHAEFHEKSWLGGEGGKRQHNGLRDGFVNHGKEQSWQLAAGVWRNTFRTRWTTKSTRPTAGYTYK